MCVAENAKWEAMALQMRAFSTKLKGIAESMPEDPTKSFPKAEYLGLPGGLEEPYLSKENEDEEIDRILKPYESSKKKASATAGKEPASKNPAAKKKPTTAPKKILSRGRSLNQAGAAPSAISNLAEVMRSLKEGISNAE